MTIDERAVAEALATIDVAVPADFGSRVRAGGRRRVVRRRAVAGAGVLAAGAVAVPVSLGIGSGGAGSVQPTQEQHVYPALYAPPPAPGTKCNSGTSSIPPSASSHPELLLLPPTGQPVIDAYLRDDATACASPHVALTALRLDGQTVAAGLVVQGPNAPTAAEVGEAGLGVVHGTPPGNAPVLGQPATEFRFGGTNHIDAYWTMPDGGQWQATVSGMSQDAAVALLNQLNLDSKAGTASLPAPSTAGWTIEPAAADIAASDTGALYADWLDPQGHKVELTVRQGPDRIDQLAAGGPAESYSPVGYVGPVQFTTVRGHSALIGTGDLPVLFWQEAQNVQVELAATGGTISSAELEQVANSLTLASPDDPRLK